MKPISRTWLMMTSSNEPVRLFLMTSSCGVTHHALPRVWTAPARNTACTPGSIICPVSVYLLPRIGALKDSLTASRMH